MAVYVDALFHCRWGPCGRYKWACHLFADTREELLEVAEDIGLKPSWLQGDGRPGRLLHFDLTRPKRARAIPAGAIPLSRREAAAKMRELRGPPRRKRG